MPDVHQSLHLARSRGCNINFTTSGNSFSTLPIYIQVSSRKPADNLANRPPHNHLCSLIGTTQQATTPHFLRGCPFSPPKQPRTTTKKGTPPNLCTILSVSTSYPPMSVAAMSTSPPKRMLCPMLANHFISRGPVAAISTSPLPATLSPLPSNTPLTQDEKWRPCQETPG